MERNSLVGAHMNGHTSSISTQQQQQSATTISTIAIQAGKAKIVLAFLKSQANVQVKIQHMEPDMIEVGSTLEEARNLRREHDELLVKLNSKQKDVVDMLTRADDIANQSEVNRQVYQAMAASLAEAWKDLNNQLNARKQLLDQSIAFHESAQSFSRKMEQAHESFSHVGVPRDVSEAHNLIHHHQDLKKSVLEASMSTLQEGQLLLEKIQNTGLLGQLGHHNHATTAACYGVEHLLELLQDRRRHLDELWLQRKTRLELNLKKVTLETELKKLTDWFNGIGDLHLSKNDLGDSLPSSQRLKDIHTKFEQEAKETQTSVLRLVKTADHLLYGSVGVDFDSLVKQLQSLDGRCEQFFVQLENQRKELNSSRNFFALAQTALSKLDEVEVQVLSTDPTLSIKSLAERHSYLSSCIIEVCTTPLLEGRDLVSRVTRDHPGVKGLVAMMETLETRSQKMSELCRAKSEASEKDQAKHKFTEKFNMLNTWLNKVVQVTLHQQINLGNNFSSAKDFLDLHERLVDDMKNKRESFSELVGSAAKYGDQSSIERANKLVEEWNKQLAFVRERIRISSTYVAFHKKAQQLAIQMDVLEEYLKGEKLGASNITDATIHYKDQSLGKLTSEFVDVESRGKDFIKTVEDAKVDERLDTIHAIKVVETLLHHFSDRKYIITEYHEFWKVHVTSGRDFNQKWTNLVKEARNVIDWMVKEEKELFAPFIAGFLGKNFEETIQLQNKIENFRPIMKKLQEAVEKTLKEVEILSLKGDTGCQREQVTNELLRVHTRLQARLNEYKVLLGMTRVFYEHLQQLDKMISHTEVEYSSKQLPSNLTNAQILLNEHKSNKNKLKSLIDKAINEGEEIVIRVRQQDAEAIASEEVQRVLLMAEDRRKQWESMWDKQRSRLEHNLHLCQFYFDLRKLIAELDELQRILKTRHGNYGTSLSSVKMISQAYQMFERSAQVIEGKVNNFSNTANTMIRDGRYDSRRIRREVDEVERKWKDFHGSISEYRKSLDESLKFFEEMELCEGWINGAAQFLVNIGQRANQCKSSEDVETLIGLLIKFKDEGTVLQNSRLDKMECIATDLYGNVSGPHKMQHVVDRNQEMINNIIKAIEELSILRDNLSKKEAILAQMELVIEKKTPRQPRIVQPLQNAEIVEGNRFTFECRLECDTKEPKIEWFKDNKPLTDSDGYFTSYKDGLIQLRIAQTTPGDTGNYRCRITTEAGETEISAHLRIKETQQKVIPPTFDVSLRPLELPEGTSAILEVRVSGLPAPTVSWFKDGQPLDGSSDYIISNVENTYSVKVRKLNKEIHSGRYLCRAANQAGESESVATVQVVSVTKPQFTEPLHDRMVKEGDKVVLITRFTGEPAPQIKWLRNDGQIIPSAIFKIVIDHGYTALEIKEIFPEDAGQYTVVARNLGGEARTSSRLDIEGLNLINGSVVGAGPPSKPKFIEPLQNKEVQEGSRAHFKCHVIGYPEPRITWYKDDRILKDTKDFQISFDGERCTFIIREVYLEDSGVYRCVAQNEYGTDSTTCRLHVEPLSEQSDVSATLLPADLVPPKFTQLLKDIEGVEGELIRFDCCVIGNPTPVVKWYRGRNQIQNSSDFQINRDKDKHSLTIPEVFKEDAGNYVVRATNAAGAAKCYASLIIKQSSDKQVMKTRLVEASHSCSLRTPLPAGHSPPEFIKLFGDTRVRPGQACDLEVIVGGHPAPRVKWLFNNEPIPADGPYRLREGPPGHHVLHILEVHVVDAGRYSIIAENETGQATCSALLVVVEDSQLLAERGESPLETLVRATPSYGPPAVVPMLQQQTKVLTVTQTTRLSQVSPIPIAPSPTFSSHLEKPCTIKPVDLVIELPVAPEFTEHLKDLNVDEGTRITFEVRVSGKPAPKITWYKHGRELVHGPRYEIIERESTVKLIIPKAQKDDTGKYVCVAKNEGGQVQSSAVLTVTEPFVPPHFKERLTTKAVKEGDSVKFTVRVAGHPNPEVTWYRGGLKINYSNDFQISQDGELHSLYIGEVFCEDAGKISVKAENRAGQTQCTAELIVESVSGKEDSTTPSPPLSRSPSFDPRKFNLSGSSREHSPPKKVQFLKPLSDTRMMVGQKLILECVLPPYPIPERIQWFKNEIELFSCPDYEITFTLGVCRLAIPQVYPQDTGRYSCTVHISGQPQTTSMCLIVNAPEPAFKAPQERAPFFTNLLTNQVLRHGGTAYFECKVSAYPAAEILWARKGHPLIDKKRYKSTYEQNSGVTTLTIYDLRDEDEGDYTCKAINSLGSIITTASLYVPETRKSSPPKTPHVVHQTFRPTFYDEVDRQKEPFKISSMEKRLQQEADFRDHQIRARPPPTDFSQPPSAPKITQKLKDCRLGDTKDVVFVCKITGHPLPGVEWYHNGKLIRPSPRHDIQHTPDGVFTLRIRNPIPEDCGHYCSSAHNSSGHDVSSADLTRGDEQDVVETSYVSQDALRRLDRSPSKIGPQEPGGVSEQYFKPVFRKIPTDLTVPEGSVTRFDCVVHGRPLPDITWLRDGYKVSEDRLHKIVINEAGVNSLIFDSVSKYDAGHYTCIASNAAGSDQFHVNLNVDALPEASGPLFVEQMRDQLVPEESTVVFSVEVEGFPLPQFLWQKDGRAIDSFKESSRYNVEQDGSRSTLVIVNCKPEDSAYYQCTAFNQIGSQVQRVKLVVQPQPRRMHTPDGISSSPRKTLPSDHSLTRQSRPYSEPQFPTVPTEISSAEIPYLWQPTKPEPVKKLEIKKRTFEIPKKEEEVLPPYVRKDPDAPISDDYYNRDKPRAPKFTTHIKSLMDLSENQPARFECKLVPLGDPDMKVEWFKDGVLLKSGHRFRPIYDLGRVALHILYTYPEDNGTYMCRAVNKYGSDTTHAQLYCKGKESVIYASQLPEGSDGVRIIQDMEEAPYREIGAMEGSSDEAKRSPPAFDLLPEAQVIEEGETAKFKVKVKGNPRPKVNWYINGNIAVSSQRFHLLYDGMIHVIEIPKVRDYEGGTVKVVAMNPLGKIEAVTSLQVIPKDDWRSHLRQTPKSIVETEMDKWKPIEPRSAELDQALKKPKTTVVELRAFERGVQEKVSSFRDDEVERAVSDINTRHAQMLRSDASRELKSHEPNVNIESEVHVIRARAMLDTKEDDFLSSKIFQKTLQTKKEPPAFTKPLQNVRVKEGLPVRFEVCYSGTPAPEIKWYREDSEIQPSRDFQISNLYQKSFLLIPEVFPEDGGTYSVRAFSPIGFAECRATLNVEDDDSKARDSGPEVKCYLQDIIVNNGEPVAFDCKIVSLPKPEIMWLKDGKRLMDGPRWKIISDEENHHTLLIYEATPHDGGVYECVATNKLGRQSTHARLTVKGQPALTETPIPLTPLTTPRLIEPIHDAVVNEGEAVQLSCKIHGEPRPVITWYHNGQPIKLSKYFQLSSSPDGTYLLNITGAFLEDQGVYKCVARNPQGQVETTARLEVQAHSQFPKQESRLSYVESFPPQFIKPIYELDVSKGGQAVFEVIVSANPNPDVVWFHEGHQIHNGPDFQLLQSNDKFWLIIKKVQMEDFGLFTCRATNPAGVAECSAKLNVLDASKGATLNLDLHQAVGSTHRKAPTITKNLPLNVQLIPGNVAKLEVHLDANPPPQITWLTGGQTIFPSTKHNISYDDGVVILLITNVQPQDSGDYILKARNDLGEVTCKTTLHVKPSKKIVELPIGASPGDKYVTPPTFSCNLKPETKVSERSVARLECQVKAVPLATVTWHLNGVELPPSQKFIQTTICEKNVLEIRDVSVSDSAVYTCKASNPAGEAITSTTLIVLSSEPRPVAPYFLRQLDNVAGTDGKEVTLNCTVKGQPMPDITWYHNHKCIDKSEDFVINYNKETGRVELVIVDCLPDDQGRFRCIAKNQAGQAVSECTLTVKPAQTVYKPAESTDVHSVGITADKVVKKIVKRTSGQPPRFIQPIQPCIARPGEQCRFIAKVAGAPQPDITWMKDKTDLILSERHVANFEPDSGTCTLLIRDVRPEDVGVYSCKATNLAGRATCTANVVVVPPEAEVTITEKTVSVKKEKVTVVGDQETRVVESSPTFIENLLPTTEAVEGETVKFACQVSAEPEPMLTWLFNGREITNSPRITLTFDRTTTTLTIFNVGPEDTGEYVCKATNSLGQSSTRTFLRIKREDMISAVQFDSIEAFQIDLPPSQPRFEPLTFDFVPSKEAEPPRFNLPLRNQTVNDGEQVVFRVLFQGEPTPMVTWFFNSQPIHPSQDFRINVDRVRGESTLVIVEVFPEDEGEYMCKAENNHGTAITHCHLFVKLPISSDDETTEKIVSRAVEIVKTQELVPIKETRRFSETIAVDHKEHMKEMSLQFQLSPSFERELLRKTKREKSELVVRRESVPRGMKLEVDIGSPPRTIQERSFELKRRIEALGTEKRELIIPLVQQRRFSETVAVEYKKKPQEMILQFKLPITPEKSQLFVMQDSAPKSVRLEVEVEEKPIERPTEMSAIDIIRTKRIQAIETQRQEFKISLVESGSSPIFLWQLQSQKVMDGDEVRFTCKVKGNPIPDVTWYHNGKVVLDNPDFRTSYNKDTGEVILFIVEVFPQDTGIYECVAINKHGSATTRAQLIVEVYEYIPDSEEATASQTESIMSSSSMDEVEFQAKTRKFLENMERIKREVFEDNVKQTFEEQVIEELDVEERGFEETIHMADVKWQLPKRVSPKYEDVTFEIAEPTISEILPERPVGHEVTSSRQISIASGRPIQSQAVPQTVPIHDTIAHISVQETKAVLSPVEATSMSKTEGGIVTTETTLKSRKEIITDEHIATWESTAEGNEVKEHYTAFEAVEQPKKEYLAPLFVQKLEPREVLVNSKVTLECEVFGIPRPEVTWFKNGVPLAGHVVVIRTDDNRCSIGFDCITPEDEGEYLCKATNEHGMATTWAELIVESKPEDMAGGTNLSVPSSKAISSSSSSSVLDSDMSQSKLVFLPSSLSLPHHSLSSQRSSAMTSESAATLSFLGGLVSFSTSSD